MVTLQTLLIRTFIFSFLAIVLIPIAGSILFPEAENLFWGTIASYVTVVAIYYIISFSSFLFFVLSYPFRLILKIIFGKKNKGDRDTASTTPHELVTCVPILDDLSGLSSIKKLYPTEVSSAVKWMLRFILVINCLSVSYLLPLICGQHIALFSWFGAGVGAILTFIAMQIISNEYNPESQSV